MNPNEIKKLLYKEKPVATLSETRVLQQVKIYKAETSAGTVLFHIPLDEGFMFSASEPAQLLCRWIHSFALRTQGMDFGNPEGDVSVKAVCLQDGDGHWYWIPENKADAFSVKATELEGKDYMDARDLFDAFSYSFEMYRTLGGKDLTPECFKRFEVELIAYARK